MLHVEVVKDLTGGMSLYYQGKIYDVHDVFVHHTFDLKLKHKYEILFLDKIKVNNKGDFSYRICDHRGLFKGYLKPYEFNRVIKG